LWIARSVNLRVNVRGRRAMRIRRRLDGAKFVAPIAPSAHPAAQSRMKRIIPLIVIARGVGMVDIEHYAFRWGHAIGLINRARHHERLACLARRSDDGPPGKLGWRIASSARRAVVLRPHGA